MSALLSALHARRTPLELDHPMTRFTTLAFSTLAFASFALSGCSMFDRTLAPGARFFVSPAAISKVDGEVLESILVQRFRTVPPTGQANFCYLKKDGSWELDASNGWFSDPSDMYCDVFAAALEQSGRFRMVGLEGVSARFDFQIEGVLESLYADYSDPAKPIAIVEMRAYLFDQRTGHRRLVASVTGAGRVEVVGTTAPALADAFSKATHDALQATIEALPKSVSSPVPAAATADANAAIVR